jgi:putative membrane protein
MRFLIHWLVVTLSLAGAAWLLPGVSIQSLGALALGGLVLGFVNAVVRPVLKLLSLPITVLTLGLFLLVVNGVAFGLAAWLTPGFTVSSFGSAVLGALAVSVISWLLGMVLHAPRGSAKA